MQVAEALATYLDIVDSCMPGFVEGLYVVGSFALDDWQEDRSDVDVVIVTAEAATDDDHASLVTVHALLAEQQPLPHIDGPYLTWSDLVTPPMALHRPWTLHGELHHDGDCFELNPVTWYVLAEHGVTVRGPSVDLLGIYVDIDARVRFVADNLVSYWRSVAADLDVATAAEPDRAFDAESFEWCALGALRLHCTAFTGEVVSKAAAGRYGLEVAPEQFAPLLRMAVERRTGAAERTPVAGELLAETGRLISWCVDTVARAMEPDQ